jgi:hypothetical protein
MFFQVKKLQKDVKDANGVVAHKNPLTLKVLKLLDKYHL